ncbi:MAG: helix-turn-helix transcriptional regulator [Bacteroidota bacterium]
MQTIFSFALAGFGVYGLSLALVLSFRKSYVPLSNKMLSILVFIFGMFLFQSGLRMEGALDGYKTLDLIIGTLWYWVAPLIFLHGYHLIHPNRGWQRIHALHLIPSLLHVMNVAPIFLLSFEEQNTWLSQGKERSDWLYQLMTTGYVLLAQFLTYIPFAVRILHRYAARHATKISVAGLNRVLITRNAYVVFGVICVVMEVLAFSGRLGNSYVVILLAMMIVIFSLGYIAMARPSALFSQIPFKWAFRSRELPEDEIEIYKSALIQEMEHRVYRDPELTLDRLATNIKLQPRQLSSLIKKEYDMRFNEFINKYRVRAAKQLLLDPKCHHWSILAIGMEVGFNSKSTFNRVFKQVEGTTPSEFQRHHTVDLNPGYGQ